MLQIFCGVMVLDTCKEDAGRQEPNTGFDLGLIDPIHQKTINKVMKKVFI